MRSIIRVGEIIDRLSITTETFDQNRNIPTCTNLHGSTLLLCHVINYWLLNSVTPVTKDRVLRLAKKCFFSVCRIKIINSFICVWSEWCVWRYDCADIRVVVVYVDAMRHGLLQREEVNWLPLQYVCGGCEELVKTPTPLLVSLQYTR